MRAAARTGSVIVTCAEIEGRDWFHASIAWVDRDPIYAEMARLKRAVWGDSGWAVMVFAAGAEHVNIHEHALHLWGRADGRPFLPSFSVVLAGVGRSI